MRSLSTAIALCIVLIAAPAWGQTNFTQVELQQAIDVHALIGTDLDLTGKTIDIQDHLYVYGDFDIIGGRLEISRYPEHGWAVVHFGTREYGGTGVDWTGEIRGMEVVTTESLEPRGSLRLFNIHRADHAKLVDLRFDVRASGDAAFGPVAALNNAAFCRSPKRRNLTYERLHVIAAQEWRGSEGLAIADCIGAVIQNCTVQGVGDDAIALHDCQSFRVLANNTSATDGRLGIFGCRDGIVQGNVHRRSRPDARGSALFQVQMERPYQHRPTNIVIEDNQFWHHPETKYITYGMRLEGGENLTLRRNHVFSFNEHTLGIRIVPQRDQLRTGGEVIPVGKHVLEHNAAREILEFAFGDTRYNLGPIIAKNNYSQNVRFFSPVEDQASTK